MNQKITARLALAIGGLALLAGAMSGCKAEADLPGLEILPGMVDSVPVDPYDRDPLGAKHGLYSIYKAPAGTVPYGAPPFRYAAGRIRHHDDHAAGAKLKSPLKGTEAELERGQFVFETWCSVCHGKKGDGDGPVVGTGRLPGPPSLNASRAKTLPDGHLFHIVMRGQGLMPSYATQVRQADAWKAIAWIRKLQGGAK